MSENDSSARNLALLALIIALVLGVFALYQTHQSTQAAQQLSARLTTVETSLQQREAQLAKAETELAELREQLKTVGTAAELRQLSEKVQTIITKAVDFEAIAEALTPLSNKLGGMDALGNSLDELIGSSALSNVTVRLENVQERIGKLSRQNDELIQYIDQRIRSIRTIAERLTPTTKTDGENYSIEPGDTLETIANELGFSLRDLLQANPEVDAKRLQIGQKITIPKE